MKPDEKEAKRIECRKDGDVVKIVPAKRKAKPKESRMKRAHGPM